METLGMGVRVSGKRAREGGGGGGGGKELLR